MEDSAKGACLSPETTITGEISWKFLCILWRAAVFNLGFGKENSVWRHVGFSSCVQIKKHQWFAKQTFCFVKVSKPVVFH